MKAEDVSRAMPQVFSILRTSLLTRHLSLRQVHLVGRVVYLSLLHGVNSSRRGVYCVPSEKYLSKDAYCARETVSRNITTIKKLGLLRVIQRRPVEGRFSTNLYKLGSLLLSLISRVTSCFFSFFNRVTLTSHIVTETSNNNLRKQSESSALHKILDVSVQQVIDRIQGSHPELA